MAIQSLQDLSELSPSELYDVYMAIATADHNWRLRTLYGDQPAPQGHHEFRPLPFEQFEHRLQLSRSLVNGEQMLRQRLSRQAAAYEVDVWIAVGHQRRAA